MKDKAIGIDIGGTKIYVGVIDKKTGIVDDYILFLKKDKNSQDIIQTINAQIASYYNQYQYEFPVGIAIAELVDNQGRICSEYTYDWIGKESAFKGKSVIFESDVRAASLAEVTFGTAKNVTSNIYISLGTGLSYCFIQDGKIWRGHNGNAIHFATSPLFFPISENPFNNPPQTITYEDFIGGKGFNKAIEELYGKEFNSEKWIEKLNEHNEQSKNIAQYHAQYLGGLLAQLVNILDPEQIIIGGGFGIALKNSPYRDFLTECITQNIIHNAHQKTLINWAKLESFSALIGAALST